MCPWLATLALRCRGTHTCWPLAPPLPAAAAWHSIDSTPHHRLDFLFRLSCFFLPPFLFSFFPPCPSLRSKTSSISVLAQQFFFVGQLSSPSDMSGNAQLGASLALVCVCCLSVSLTLCVFLQLLFCVHSITSLIHT